jgi:transcription elongation factor GreA
MTQDEAFYITDEGLQKIKEELITLKTTKRVELARKLEIAIGQGDLKENADYHSAKEEQGFTEGRIRDLEDALRRAVVIKETGPSDRVRVGSTVTVIDEEYGDEETYSIVGPHEANPSEGRISNQSPIGRALLGAKIGQTVVASSPAGEIRLQIQAIA